MIKLKELSVCADEKDCAAISDELERFAESASIDEKTRQNILSSVMRKAGSEMDSNITMSKTKKRKHGKRLFAIIAAAVMIVLCAVGAGAYFLDRAGIINGMKLFYPNIAQVTEEELKSLDSIINTNGEMKENTFESLDVKFDGTVCDGNHMFTIFTVSKKDGTPFTAPEGYEWRTAYNIGEPKSILLVPHMAKYGPFRSVEYYPLLPNDDGTLSVRVDGLGSFFSPMFDTYTVSFDGLYLIPESGKEEIVSLGRISDTRNENDTDEAFSAKEDRYREALKEAAAESYEGRASCRFTLDKIAGNMEYTAYYKGEEVAVTVTPIYVTLSCYDSEYQFDKNKQDGMLQIYFTDGSSLNGIADSSMQGNSKTRGHYSWSFSFLNGKPIAPGLIDYIVFNGERLDLNEQQ